MMVRITTAFALLGLLIGGGAPAALADNAAAVQPRSVIELFTSQGCSSCPAADRLFGEYADREDVLALSFNVDVWDWIGWKDTLASSDNTRRQRAYADAMGERSIYTPQVIVDGRTHVVGSNRAKIEQALADAGPLTVPIDLAMTPDSMTVTVGASDDPQMPHGQLWLVLYDRAVTVEIQRGENTGKTVTYNNVVRKLRPISMWKGEAMSIDMSRMEIEHADTDGCAFLLQAETADGRPGPMLGAARIAANAW